MSFGPAQGSGSGGGDTLLAYAQAGTSPLELWYGPNLTLSKTTNTPPIDSLRAQIFAGRAGVLDRIEFEVTTLAAGGVGRAGIYKATSKTNIYPNELVVDGGEQSTATTGSKISTISTVLEAGVLYWLAYLPGVLAAVVRGSTPNSNVRTPLGSPVPPGGIGADHQEGLTVAQAYGALPSTFPAGAIAGTGIFAAVVHVRYSS